MLREKKAELAPRRESPYGLFEEFDRVFDDFRTGLEGMLWTPSPMPLRPWAADPARQALVDVQDTGPEYIVTADLPGVQKDHLEIEVTEDGAEIRAEVADDREETDAGYVHRERSHASWYRRIPLPEAIVPDQAEAELRDGVLSLRLPKRAPAPEKKSRKVPVK